MVQYQLKLRMCKAQERECERWLYHLGAVYNFAVRKIELNAADKIYFTKFEFQTILAGHSKTLGIPSHVIQGVLCTVHDAWKRYFTNVSGKPRLKGVGNRLNSIPFPDPIESPKAKRIALPYLGSIRFHKMGLPEGPIKCARMVKRASGWHLCLFIDANPKTIARVGFGKIGIDPGFSSLLTTSGGEKIPHPRELESAAARLAQAQRGHNRHLAARIQERIANRRKDRNHKLTRRLVAENVLIVWSNDNHAVIAKRFGKSVSSSAHAQIRRMLAYKSPTSGTTFIEISPNYSTMTCNECGCLSGPAGLSGLSVRQWACRDCGASHDRDVNAAINALNVGAGCAHELASA